MDNVNPILAQKLGLTSAEDGAKDVDAAPATPMRQMRRALARAMDKAVGLTASVSGITEEELDAEKLIEGGPEGWIVLGLRDGANAGLTGLFLLDPPLRSALVEMQTMGNLLPPAEDERKVTRTDAVMTVPFADKLLKELAEAGFGTGEFDPAAYDMGPMDDLRTAGLVMMQGRYRVWRVTIQIGGGECTGEVMIAIRPKVTAAPAAINPSDVWAANLRGALEDAPADLDAELCKMTLPISKIEEFEVDQVLHLAGTTVGSVTLMGPAGQAIATARLGQVAGKRAVRIEPMHVELQDDTPKVVSSVPQKPPVATLDDPVPETELIAS